MLGGDRSKDSVRLVAFRDDPKLLLYTPTTAPFPCAKDLNRAIRHDFKVDLKVGFKVITLATNRPHVARRSSPDELMSVFKDPVAIFQPRPR